MSIDLKKWLLGLGLNLLLAGTASAQVGAFSPLTEPSDFQFFVQPDLSNYGSGVQPNTGWFGSVEYLLWATTNPNRTQVGVQDGARSVYNGNHGFTIQTNSADSSFIHAAMRTGTRYEIGFMNDENRGWFFSGYRLGSSTSELVQTNASMVFAEPNLPVFDNRSGVFTQITTLPILNGFVDNEGAFANSGAATTPAPQTNQPDGVADDINRNNTFGPYGIDQGSTFPFPIPNQYNRIPDAPLIPGAAYANIDYGDAVALPVLFSNLNVKHRSSNYSVELNRQWRMVTGRFGGNLDVFAGARYTNFDDQFAVDALGGILADSYWNAKAQNHVVGGQIGFRVNQKNGRLTLSTEGRIFTGADFQTVRLDGQIGSRLTQTLLSSSLPTTSPNSTVNSTFPNGGGTNEGGGTSPPTTPTASTYTQAGASNQANNPGQGTMATRLNQPLSLNRTTFGTSRNFTSFSPLGELRLKAQYQVFDAVQVNCGWTGTFMDGIMRANNMIDYTLPSMGIVGNRNVQGVFINGINMGVEINR